MENDSVAEAGKVAVAHEPTLVFAGPLPSTAIEQMVLPNMLVSLHNACCCLQPLKFIQSQFVYQQPKPIYAESLVKMGKEKIL